MQSHDGTIHLLPALPDAWPEGKVSGFRAHGGFVIDLAWKEVKVTEYRLRSKEPQQVKLRVNGKQLTVTSEKL